MDEVVEEAGGKGVPGDSHLVTAAIVHDDTMCSDIAAAQQAGQASPTALPLESFGKAIAELEALLELGLAQPLAE